MDLLESSSEDGEVFLCDNTMDECISRDLEQNLNPEDADEAAGRVLNNDVQNLYKTLVELGEENLVLYPSVFTCPLCLVKCEPYEGIILKECLHAFCKDCLRRTIHVSEEIDIKCPYKDSEYTCASLILENEIQTLLTAEEYDSRLQQSLQFAVGNADVGKSNLTDSSNQDLYKLLATLQEENLVLHPYDFECPVCLDSYGPYEGVTLKECLHIFCKECLRKSIQLSEGVDIKCPYQDEDYSCPSLLLEHEIQSLLTPEEYSARLQRSLQHAAATTEAAFHCKRPDCSGWCVNEEGLTLFECPVCRTTNCIPCGAIHTGISCAQYAEAASMRSGGMEVVKSQRVLNEMVRLGTAMYCPQCTAVVEKVAGCDALVCTVCRTQLCWATKGRRWGPAGQGDNSAGCRCNVNGRKCHALCNNCH